jgi:putative membrane protein
MGPYMWGSMGWWMVLWWVAGIVVLVWLVRLVAGSAGGVPTRGDDSPEQILKRRYAKGDIEREEYQRRLEDLRR